MIKQVKSNIRSYRYSDRVASILESQEGSSLNDKFETLVIECHEKLPIVEKRVQELQETLEKLQISIKEAKQELLECNSLIRAKNRLSSEITQLSIFACDYKENVTQHINAAATDEHAAVK